MLLANKKIAIVGGGPGGLTLAVLLQQGGADIKVYERDLDRNARVQGSPLDLHEHSGLAALRQAGLLEVFRQNFMPGADRKVIVNEKAEVFLTDHDKPQENFGEAFFRPEIDRGALRSMLLDALQPGTVEWDRQFLSMAKQGERWILLFKSGETASADIVIAADGANSRIRPYLTDIKPFYSGITMLEGNVIDPAIHAPKINALSKGGKIMAFGKGKDLLLGHKGNGDLGFYASLKVPESWVATNGINYHDRQAVLKWYQREFTDWDPVWDELFENAETPFIPRPIYCMPPDQSWASRFDLTLLGDAAHVMPPFAGEGANMAMLDALELSNHLTDNRHVTVLEAISAYEVQMHKRASAAARASLENGERMHADNALAEMLALFDKH